MVEKTDNLEEQLLNGPKKEKKSLELPPVVKKIWEQVKKLFQKHKKTKVSHKKKFMMSLIFLWCIFLGIVAIAITIYTKDKALKNKTPELGIVKNYEINNLKEFGFTDNDSSILSIDKLIEKYQWYKDQNKKYEWYIYGLQAPYNNFLRHIYLPSLNIWKDQFTGELDTSIIWQKYIEKNPYEDTKLHSKWTKFFKYVGKNKEFNTIENITIDGIQQDKENPELFIIPIKIDFISNTKRSFLLLLNKLSITSNPENISLINEFVYYLWKNIKEKKADVILSMQKEDSIYSWWNDDKIIGYTLYRWIKDDKDNDLVDEVLLNELISEVMLCTDNNTEVCFYRFREKYASLPSLAYTVGIENNTNKKRDLKEFFSDINMLMKVDDFSFDRIKNEESLFLNNNIKYKWSMKIVLYGKGMTDQEIKEIEKKLGMICTQRPLNGDTAIEDTNEKIKELWEISKRLKTTEIKKLWELKAILEKINTEYPSYTNNEKAIKLFEIYRMLHNANVCKLRG